MTREELIKAFEMKLDGYSYEKIGETLGYTRQTCKVGDTVYISTKHFMTTNI